MHRCFLIAPDRGDLLDQYRLQTQAAAEETIDRTVKAFIPAHAAIAKAQRRYYSALKVRNRLTDRASNGLSRQLLDMKLRRSNTHETY